MYLVHSWLQLAWTHLVHKQLAGWTSPVITHSLFSIYKGSNQPSFNIPSHLWEADPQPLSFR